MNGGRDGDTLDLFGAGWWWVGLVAGVLNIKEGLDTRLKMSFAIYKSVIILNL